MKQLHFLCLCRALGMNVLYKNATSNMSNSSTQLSINRVANQP